MLDRMAAPDVDELWLAITVLENQETLLAQRVAVYPNMKEKAQRDEHKRVHKEAYPTYLYPPKTTTLKELSKKLNRG